jgi:hypothetical protein
LHPINSNEILNSIKTDREAHHNFSPAGAGFTLDTLNHS